jgi:hypothetical protein
MRGDWEPLQAPVPLEFGTAMHSALEVYYDPETWTGDRVVVQILTKQRFVDVCNEQKKIHLQASDSVDLIVEKDEEFAARVKLGLGMLDHYFIWAPKQDTELIPVMTEIEFEVPVIVPSGLKLRPGFMVGGNNNLLWCNSNNIWIPVVYQGRIDLLVQETCFPNRYWIVDHKTTGNMGSVEWLDLDEQGGSYCWALREKLGLNIAGVVYNQLLKDYPKPPKELVNGGYSQNKQQRTTYETYLRALEKAGEPLERYTEYLHHLRYLQNPFCRRIQIHRSRREIENLERTICLEAIDMIDNPSIYRNAGPFTCMNCAYKPPCLADIDGQDVQFILNEYYRKRSSVES